MSISVERQVVVVPGLADPARYGFAQCVVAAGLAFAAGQLGIDEDYRLVSNDFDAQASQALCNLGLALSAASSCLDRLVSMMVCVTDMRYSERFFKVRQETMGNVMAASATYGVNHLALPGALVEVQGVAVVSAADRKET